MKKFTCAFLSLLLILSLALVPAYADDATPATVGYSADLVVPKEGLASLTDITAVEGDMPTEVKISNAAGMQKLAELVNDGNTFQNKTVYLEKDIYMTGVTNWIPIGNNTGHIVGNTNTPYFEGTFDGQGYSIKNLTVSSNEDGNVNVAIFGRLLGGTIKNLVIDETCSFTYTGTSTTAKTAALVASAFRNGGFIYKISNVQNNASVTASNGYVGGVLATAGANTTNTDIYIEYCTNTGAITANGKINATTNVWSDGGDTGSLDAIAGGVVGYTRRSSLTVQYCLNTGTITAPGYAGGIMGGHNIQNDVVTIQNCRNDGAVTGAHVGGLLGHGLSGNDSVKSCINTGVVTALEGGKAGQLWCGENNIGRDANNKEAVNTVKVLGYQKALDITTEDNATYRSVRLVGVLNPGDADLSEFDLVGLEITVTYTKDGKTVTKELNGNSTTVYQSLCGMANTEDDPTPLEKAEGEYYFAIVLENIPTAIENVKLNITPYFVEGGESATTVYGFTAHTTVSVAEEPEAN